MGSLSQLSGSSSGSGIAFITKLKTIPYVMVLFIVSIVSLGGAALYSAAGGEFYQWADKHFLRFSLLFIMMFVIAIIPLKYWYYTSYPLWAVGIVLLVVVEAMGHVGMGAQRWINLGFMNLQPSELMKIAVVMALAKYFHDLNSGRIRQLASLIIPCGLIGLPMGLVMLQPDLGTALMIAMAGICVLFLAGIPMWIFVTGAVSVSAAIPLIYQYVLKDYQRARVDTFLDPSRDPMGAGYHVTQSKIAIGSGGWDGKGYLEGTQARLNFLPEKHTDFIFTLWAEEQGFLGGLFVIGLYIATFILGGVYALQSRYVYSRLLAFGLIVNLSLYVMINTGMVMGVLPVVGVPMPLVSYGGSAMLSALICYGLIICVKIHKGQSMPKGGEI